MERLHKFRLSHPRIALAIDIACYVFAVFLCISPVVANGSWVSAALGGVLLLSFGLFRYGSRRGRFSGTEST